MNEPFTRCAGWKNYALNQTSGRPGEGGATERIQRMHLNKQELNPTV